ncbi:hypothetical protein [Pseudoxanthomonas mexicana]|uniref:PglD-related sugar-binding protein n=1 Tax=Pseudoxanthomonas mexicana TaxID=128785 RepID=UPI00398B537A
MKKPLLIIGGSSFGSLSRILAEECGHQVAGFVDDFHTGPDVLGRMDDLGSRLAAADFGLVMAIGYKHLPFRFDLFRRLVEAGFDFPRLLHPSARISAHAEIGAGCMVMASADIDAFSRLGDACVVWPHATISHDNDIGANTFISPAATLCGFVSVGHSSFIGANSTLVNGASLPANSFVKAATRHHGTTGRQ